MPHPGLYLYPLIFFSYFLFFSLIFVKRYSTASWCKTKAYCKTWALPLVSCLYWHQGKFPFFHFKKSKLVTVDIITYQRQVLEPCQTSEMKHLAKEVNGFQLFSPGAPSSLFGKVVNAFVKVFPEDKLSLSKLKA